VIFLYGASSTEVPAQTLIGSALGFSLALACYGLLARGGRLFSWRVFFRITEILLLLLGGALLVDAMDKLIGLEALPPLVDPLWNADFLLDDSSRAGGFVAAFTGWRAHPAGSSYLALALWWGLAWLTVLRVKTKGVRR